MKNYTSSKNNTASNSIIKRRIIAGILSATCMVSTLSAVTSVAASAAELRPTANISVSNIANSNISPVIEEGLMSGVSTLMSSIYGQNLVTNILGEGLFGAFKAFYGQATSSPEPSNAEIADLLNNLAQNITAYHNEEMQKLTTIENMINLNEFSNLQNKIIGYNKKSLAHIGNKAGDLNDEDYREIIKNTVDKEGFENTLTDISNFIINGSQGIKGMPSFKQYFDLAKNSSDNSYDYDKVKADTELFMNMFMEQYAVMYTSLMTGYTAKYKLIDKNTKLDDKTKNSMLTSVITDMNLYTNYCRDVVTAYKDTMAEVNDAKTSEITINGKTTSKFSLADTWVTASRSNGNVTIKLFKDWKTDNLGNDTYEFKGNSAFKNNVMYLNNGSANITIDLNGHSIKCDTAREYDIFAENSNITITDSSNSKKSVISGISVSHTNLNVSNVIIDNSTGTGVRADKSSKVTISNSTISNCKNSAVVNKNGSITTINNCNINNNLRTGVYNTASMTISDCSFTGNNASDDGGAVYNSDSLTVTNSTFKDNTAKNGAGIYSKDNLTVKGCTFLNNKASNNGGAICSDYYGNGFTSKALVDGCVMRGNTANSNGGGIYADSMSYLDMFDTEITNNTAGNGGAGLFAQKGSSSSCDPTIGGKITITNNRLTNGTLSNAFLQENSTSKCIFKLSENRKLDSSSRIGITSNTNDKCLDIVKIFSKDSYNRTKNVFSYDTSKYKINRYSPWYSDLYWIEIKK